MVTELERAFRMKLNLEKLKMFLSENKSCKLDEIERDIDEVLKTLSSTIRIYRDFRHYSMTLPLILLLLPLGCILIYSVLELIKNNVTIAFSNLFLFGWAISILFAAIIILVVIGSIAIKKPYRKYWELSQKIEGFNKQIRNEQMLRNVRIL